MSPALKTRSKITSTASSKSGKQQSTKTAKRARSSAGAGEGPVTMTAAERMMLEQLLAKQKQLEKRQTVSRKAGEQGVDLSFKIISTYEPLGIRKNVVAMIVDEASECESEERAYKRPRFGRYEESSTDEAGEDGQDSQESTAQEDKTADDAEDDEDPEIDEEEREIEQFLVGSTRKRRAPVSLRKDTSTPTWTVPPSSSKANAEPAVTYSTAGRKIDSRTPRISKADRPVTHYAQTVSVPAKSKKGAREGKVADKTASLRASSTKKAVFTPIVDDESDDAEREGGRTDSEEVDELDEESGEEDGEGGNDVVILKGKPGGAKRKSRKGSKASVRRRKRASAANLPDSISLVKKLATSYLKMYLALEEAWTKHTTITSRLLHRNDVIKKAILSVRAQSNTDGRCPPEVKYAFDKLGSSGPEAESLQKILTEMVWQGGMQMRSDLRQRAKSIVDEAYGLTGLKAQQKQALVTWLTTSCQESLKDDVVVSVPNFIFPVDKVVWVDERRGRGSCCVDGEKSKLNTRMPFQHPAISRLIYSFWFNGQTQAEVKARTERFSVVPDNLVALVCNALDVALKGHLQANANSPRDLQFSNKHYAPKWDNLMMLLEEIKRESPGGYRTMKAVIWGRIHAKIREDEKVRGLDESTPSQPKNRIPFHDLHDLSVNNEPGEEDIGQENGKVPRGSVQGTSSARTNLTGSSRLHPMPLRER